METLKAIKKRVSVRKFKDKPIKKTLLFKILEAARYTPSAGNCQTWRFIVLDDKEVINRIAKATLQPEVFYNVPYVVVVCSDQAKMRRLFPQRGELYAIQEVAAAIQNILLAATDYGVDSLWVGAFADETVKAVLQIPQDIEVYAILPFGYRGEVPYKSKKMMLPHLVVFNWWKNKNVRSSFTPLSQHIDKLKSKLKRKKKPGKKKK